jgi:hypothetical protein
VEKLVSSAARVRLDDPKVVRGVLLLQQFSQLIDICGGGRLICRRV